MPNLIVQGIEYHQVLSDFRDLIKAEVAKALEVVKPDSQSADELLTIKAAAALLGVSISCLLDWKRRGLLAYRKIGGRAYLLKGEVLDAGTRQQRSYKPARVYSAHKKARAI